MNSELISIIIPAYNVEQYIDKCLQSCIGQTYQDLEIIVVNDGSTDSTLLHCLKAAENDTRIKVLDKENGGQSSARNLALGQCHGKYILFLDSDDYLEINTCTEVLDFMKAKDADIVQFGMRAFKENGDEERRTIDCKDEISYGEEALFELYGRQAHLFASVIGKFYKRASISSLLFPEGRIYEDSFVIHKIFQKDVKTAWYPRCLYNYLLRNGSTTNSEFTLKKLDKLWAAVKRLEDLENRDFPLKQKLLPYAARDLLELSLVFLPKVSKNSEEMSKIICHYKNTWRHYHKSYTVSIKKRGVYFFTYMFPTVYAKIHK